MPRPIRFVLATLALASGCEEEPEKDRAPVGMMAGDDSSIVPGAEDATETEGPSTSTGSGGTTGATTDTGGDTAGGSGGSGGDTVGGGTTGAEDTDDGPSLTTDEPPPE